MLGRLTETQMEQVLRSNIVGRLGCHAEGETYVVPISYAYDGTHLYGHTQEGLKVELMRKNPNICLLVDEMEDMGNWRSVILWGRFEELKETGARESAMRFLLDRTLPYLTGETTLQHVMRDAHLGRSRALDGVMYKIVPLRKTGRFEKR
ncbi:pyridoxamine 5'-phosphate oxidase family protein [Maribacter sp. 2307ULW6-5]|uniref:pyridoxamine 5'-phosphate oxidase family protein n=1 Tax=Maribacter sp. 2307ULW6-5 TaxID=3386275 RepID=UPI0039BCF35A